MKKFSKLSQKTIVKNKRKSKKLMKGGNNTYDVSCLKRNNNIIGHKCSVNKKTTLSNKTNTELAAKVEEVEKKRLQAAVNLAANQAKAAANQAKAKAAANQAKANQAKAEANQAAANQAKANQAKANQAATNQAKANQAAQIKEKLKKKQLKKDLENNLNNKKTTIFSTTIDDDYDNNVNYNNPTIKKTILEDHPDLTDTYNEYNSIKQQLDELTNNYTVSNNNFSLLAEEEEKKEKIIDDQITAKISSKSEEELINEIKNNEIEINITTLKGIANETGNECFFNTLLQLLFSMPEIRKLFEILKYSDIKNIKYTNYSDECYLNRILKGMKKFSDLFNNTLPSINGISPPVVRGKSNIIKYKCGENNYQGSIYSFLVTLLKINEKGDLLSSNIDNYRLRNSQQDASEALIKLLEIFDNENIYLKVINDLTAFYNISITECINSNKKISYVFSNSFVTISINSLSNSTQDILNNYFKIKNTVNGDEEYSKLYFCGSNMETVQDKKLLLRKDNIMYFYLENTENNLKNKQENIKIADNQKYFIFNIKRNITEKSETKLTYEQILQLKQENETTFRMPKDGLKETYTFFSIPHKVIKIDKKIEVDEYIYVDSEKFLRYGIFSHGGGVSAGGGSGGHYVYYIFKDDNVFYLSDSHVKQLTPIEITNPSIATYLTGSTLYIYIKIDNKPPTIDDIPNIKYYPKDIVGIKYKKNTRADLSEEYFLTDPNNLIIYIENKEGYDNKNKLDDIPDEDFNLFLRQYRSDCLANTNRNAKMPYIIGLPMGEDITNNDIDSVFNIIKKYLVDNVVRRVFFYAHPHSGNDNPLIFIPSNTAKYIIDAQYINTQLKTIFVNKIKYFPYGRDFTNYEDMFSFHLEKNFIFNNTMIQRIVDTMKNNTLYADYTDYQKFYEEQNNLLMFYDNNYFWHKVINLNLRQ